MERKQNQRTETTGIKIKYYYDEKLPVYINPKKGQHTCLAVFYIDKRVSGENFVSSPEIRQALKNTMEKKSVGIGAEIGYITLDLYSQSKKVIWNEYWPFRLDRESMEKKGIAGILEEKVFDHVEKKFFVPETVRHRAFGFRRWKQLKHRGTKVPRIPFWPFSSSYAEERAALKSPRKRQGLTKRA